LKQLIKISLIYILAGMLGLPVILFAQDESNLTIHVVQRGENLFRIALQYNLSTDEVASANGITDISNIQVGQRLVIPIEVAPPQERQVHNVTAGETLQSIAALYNKPVEELSELNNLNNINQIYVGQELVIIPSEEDLASPTPEPAETDTNSDTEIIEAITSVTPEVTISDDPTTAFIHTVQAGETLFRIGLQYDLTVTDLAQANNLLDPTQIYAGQQLIIPGIEPPQIALDLPEIVADFTVKPLFFVEGRTGRIQIETTQPVAISGQFLNQELTIISEADGTQHYILIGIPIFTDPNVYELDLNLVDTTGGITPITANLQVIAGGYGRQTISIENEELLSETVEEAEIGLIKRTTSQFNPVRSWTGSLSLPAAATMNGVFGTIRSYNGSPFNRFHRGVDFAGAPGTPVLAAADGTVVIADALNIRGNTVVIDHGWGVFTLYAHQNTLLVSPGEQVISGQALGTIGSTGRITGPHLHWEVWVNGISVDPLQWVQEIFP
jgi:murein DD-endopeptidase MepM/ murein hydrolase activator NlpD